MSETVVGTPASSPVEPPQPLEPVAWRPKTPREIADGAQMVKLTSTFMREEFENLTKRKVPQERDYSVRWAAWRILEAGGDPVSFVRYVVENSKKTPYWARVFGKKAVEGWLPEFTKRQVEVADRATYEAPAERRDAYAERMKQAQLP